MTPELQTLHDLWLVRWGYTYVRLYIGPDADEETRTWLRIARTLSRASTMSSVSPATDTVIFKLKETKE